MKEQKYINKMFQQIYYEINLKRTKTQKCINNYTNDT